MNKKNIFNYLIIILILVFIVFLFLQDEINYYNIIGMFFLLLLHISLIYRNSKKDNN